jgi:hypothetical protein
MKTIILAVFVVFAASTAFATSTSVNNVLVTNTSANPVPVTGTLGTTVTNTSANPVPVTGKLGTTVTNTSTNPVPVTGTLNNMPITQLMPVTNTTIPAPTSLGMGSAATIGYNMDASHCSSIRLVAFNNNLPYTCQIWDQNTGATLASASATQSYSSPYSVTLLVQTPTSGYVGVQCENANTVDITVTAALYCQ